MFSFQLPDVFRTREVCRTSLLNKSVDRIKIKQPTTYATPDDSSSITATLIFRRPDEKILPSLNTDSDDLDQDSIIFNDLKTPTIGNKVRHRNGTVYVDEREHSYEKKIKENVVNFTVQGKDGTCANELREQESTVTKHETKDYHLNLKENEESNSNSLKSNELSNTLPLHLELNSQHTHLEQKSTIRNPSIYDVRISSTTSGRKHSRKGKSKLSRIRDIPELISIGKIESNNPPTKQKEYVCPSCKICPLVYQERKMGKDSKEVKHLPPYCQKCKAYIVLESSNKTCREEQLGNLAEWMIDIENLESENHKSNDSGPLEGTILVMLDNKTIATHHEHLSPVGFPSTKSEVQNVKNMHKPIQVDLAKAENKSSKDKAIDLTDPIQSPDEKRNPEDVSRSRHHEDTETKMKRDNRLIKVSDNQNSSFNYDLNELQHWWLNPLEEKQSQDQENNPLKKVSSNQNKNQAQSIFDDQKTVENIPYISDNKPNNVFVELDLHHNDSLKSVDEKEKIDHGDNLNSNRSIEVVPITSPNGSNYHLCNLDSNKTKISPEPIITKEEIREHQLFHENKEIGINQNTNFTSLSNDQERDKDLNYDKIVEESSNRKKETHSEKSVINEKNDEDLIKNNDSKIGHLENLPHIKSSTESIHTDLEEEMIMNDYTQKRDMVAKVIGKKLKHGYCLTQKQCKTCEMPVMEKDGFYHCVACVFIKRTAKKIARKKREFLFQKKNTTAVDTSNRFLISENLKTPRMANLNCQNSDRNAGIKREGKNSKIQARRTRANDSMLPQCPHNSMDDISCVEEKDNISHFCHKSEYNITHDLQTSRINPPVSLIDDRLNEILEFEAGQFLDLQDSKENMNVTLNCSNEKEVLSPKTAKYFISEKVEDFNWNRDLRVDTSLAENTLRRKSPYRCRNTKHNSSIKNSFGGDSEIFEEVFSEFDSFKMKEDKSKIISTSNEIFSGPENIIVDSDSKQDHHTLLQDCYGPSNPAYTFIGAQEGNNFDECETLDDNNLCRTDYKIAWNEENHLLSVMEKGLSELIVPGVDANNSHISEKQPDSRDAENCTNDDMFSGENIYQDERDDVETFSNGVKQHQPDYIQKNRNDLSCTNLSKENLSVEMIDATNGENKSYTDKNDWNSEVFSNKVFLKLKEGWTLTPYQCTSCVGLQMKSKSGEVQCILCDSELSDQESKEDVKEMTNKDISDLPKAVLPDTSTDDRRNRILEVGLCSQIDSLRKSNEIKEIRKTNVTSNPNVINADTNLTKMISPSKVKSHKESKVVVSDIEHRAIDTKVDPKFEATMFVSNSPRDGEFENNKSNSKTRVILNELIMLEDRMANENISKSSSFGSEYNPDICGDDENTESGINSLAKSIDELSQIRNIFDGPDSMANYFNDSSKFQNIQSDYHTLKSPFNVSIHENNVREEINNIIRKQREIDEEFKDIVPSALDCCLSPMNRYVNQNEINFGGLQRKDHTFVAVPDNYAKSTDRENKTIILPQQSKKKTICLQKMEQILAEPVKIYFQDNSTDVSEKLTLGWFLLDSAPCDNCWSPMMSPSLGAEKFCVVKSCSNFMKPYSIDDDGENIIGIKSYLSTDSNDQLENDPEALVIQQKMSTPFSSKAKEKKSTSVFDVKDILFGVDHRNGFNLPMKKNIGARMQHGHSPFYHSSKPDLDNSDAPSIGKVISQMRQSDRANRSQIDEEQLHNDEISSLGESYHTNLSEEKIHVNRKSKAYNARLPRVSKQKVKPNPERGAGPPKRRNISIESTTTSTFNKLNQKKCDILENHYLKFHHTQRAMEKNTDSFLDYRSASEPTQKKIELNYDLFTEFAQKTGSLTPDSSFHAKLIYETTDDTFSESSSISS